MLNIILFKSSSLISCQILVLYSRHFALKTDDVDGCVKAVREAGYPITVEPKDIVIPSQPEFPVRVAFCNGPTGEEIEFFQEK